MAAPKKVFIHPAVHIPNEVMDALIKASSESKHPLDLEGLYSKLSTLYIVNVRNITSFWQLALIAGFSHDVAITDASVRDEGGGNIAHYAALSGNPDALSAVLKTYPNLADQKDNAGRSIAHYAALSGNPDALSAVLKTYPNLADQKTNAGSSIAHYAALSGNPDALSVVLKTYPNLADQKTTNGGGSIAHYAAWSGNPDALSAVLKKYPDLARQKDNDGRSIAHYAALSGNPDALSVVLKTYPNLADQKTNGGGSIAHYAALSGNPDALSVVLKTYPNLADQKTNGGGSIAHYAAWSGNPDALSAVLKKYPDLARQKDNDGRSIAHYAAWYGNSVLLNMALSHLKLTTLNLDPRIIPDRFKLLSIKTLRKALETNITLTEVSHSEVPIEIKALLTLNKLSKNLPFIKPDELRPDKITPQCFLERALNYQPKGFFSKGLSVEEKKMLNEVLSDLNGREFWAACVQFMNERVQHKNPSSLMRDLRTFAEACETLKLGPIDPNAEPDLSPSYDLPSIN